MKRFLISGHKGFLGTHLSRHLEDQGHEVVGLRQDVSVLITHPIGKLDYVLHLASHASPKDFLAKPLETLKANSTGTENMLDVARATGATFFYPSSSQVYPEKDPSAPRSVYAEAKRYGEALVSTYGREFKINCKLARMFNVYGPGMRPDDGRVVPNFISLALRGEDITILGGTQLVSFTYVDDMIDALHRFLFLEIQGPIELGNPKRISICDLAREIVYQTKSKSKVKIQYAEFKSERPVDMEGARMLGWKPTTSIEEGIKRTIEWMREAK